MSENRSKTAFLEGGGSLSAQISEGRGHCSPTTVGVRKLRVIAVSCGIKTSAAGASIPPHYGWEIKPPHLTW